MNEVWKNIIQPYKRVELVGISGTGKSTITEKTETLYSNVSNSLSLKEYPWLALKTSFRNPIGAFYIVTSSKGKLQHRVNFNLAFQSSIFLKVIVAESKLNSHLVLDQGIVFSHIIALKEGYINENKFITGINEISSCFDFVVLLEAPKEILYNRIKDRENQGIGRAKDMSLLEFSDFYDEYFSNFKLLEKTKLNLVRLDSSKLNPTEIGLLIMNHN